MRESKLVQIMNADGHYGLTGKGGSVGPRHYDCHLRPQPQTAGVAMQSDQGIGGKADGPTQPSREVQHQGGTLVTAQFC